MIKNEKRKEVIKLLNSGGSNSDLTRWAKESLGRSIDPSFAQFFGELYDTYHPSVQDIVGDRTENKPATQ